MRLHAASGGSPGAGSIQYEGQGNIDDADVDPVQIRLKIGMVFQKPNPFPSMTIRGNVLSGLRLSGMKRPDHDAIVEETLTSAGRGGTRSRTGSITPPASSPAGSSNASSSPGRSPSSRTCC
jgi:ABC-type Fe3+/spermidine/putrescine transport system ATPase subunit